MATTISKAKLIKALSPGSSITEAKAEWDQLSEADKADLIANAEAHPEQIA